MTRQTPFRAGLLDPGVAAPEGLSDGQNRPAGRRYDVYRNNVTHSLVTAMAAAFPLVRGLLGQPRFDEAARAFVRQHPPVSPLLMHYGADFPDWLGGFEPLADLAYLADAARLDLALRASYHAADAPTLDPATLQGLATDDLMQRRFSLAPATVILRSRWPIFDIWRRNRDSSAPQPRASAQDVLITRIDYDPLPHLLPPGAASWHAALESGMPLGEAADRVAAASAEFDLGACLTLALTTQAFRGLAP